MSKDGRKRIRLYRFFNMVASKHGEPFAMCDFHKATYRGPETCIMEVLCDRTSIPCDMCEQELEEEERDESN